MAIMTKFGAAVGTSAAYLVEGTRLGSSQFAAGTRAGYTTTATALRAKREAIAQATGAPAVQRQLPVAVATA